MRISRATALLFLIVGAACGPAESLPPAHDAGPPTSDAGETCDGVCVPLVIPEWFGPELVWIGAEADAPSCPPVAPVQTYTGHGYEDGDLHCGECKCEAPSGSCALPATVTAAAASCAGDGPSVPHTSFDPPESWDGTCTAANAIPAGKLCGGVPCVQSVTIAPLVVKQGGCLPVGPPVPPLGTVFVRACIRAPSFLPCPPPGLNVCGPVPPDPSFRQCISTYGDASTALLECPLHYPSRHVFYDDNVPYCSPCACGIPIDGSCNGSISISEGGACGTPLISKLAITSTGPTCTDVPPGPALASKTASEPSYSAGACHPSGGFAQGTVFCCLP